MSSSTTSSSKMQKEKGRIPAQRVLDEYEEEEEGENGSDTEGNAEAGRPQQKRPATSNDPDGGGSPSGTTLPPKRARAVDLIAEDQQQFTQRQELSHWEERKPEAPGGGDGEKGREEEKSAAAAALTKAGGAYIPPAKLRMMQLQLGDKSSEAYQRMGWERLKKKIHGQVNRVNKANIVDVVRTLLQENVLRGKGLLARSIIQAQSFSPSFSHVFAALVAIINSKFPNIGELILRRLIIQFKRSFRRNDKITCVTVAKFIAHLANQRVAHEILVLEMLVLLMQSPTDDSIEVTVTLLKDCGAMLQKVTPKGTTAIFERLRAILNDCDTIEPRTQYMIETMFHIRKMKFEGYPIMPEELDLIDEDDQIAHLMQLNPDDGKPHDPELQLNIFKYDPDFERTEAEYDEIRREIIGDDGDESEEGEAGDDASGGGEEEDDEDAPLTSVPASKETPGATKIVDMTEQDMVAFRRNVYLTIQSSLDFQEAAHKLIKNELRPGMEKELCHMIVDCCAQQRTYERFYGLLAERFCKLRKEFQEVFEKIARDSYHAIHRFDITKLRNMANLVAHLLASDAISWQVLEEIRLNEADTTSSGRIYIKVLFQQLVEIMSLAKVYERTVDPTLQTAFEGLFPRDHPKNSRFAINFFSLIGLGGLTIDLREHLTKRLAKERKKAEIAEKAKKEESSEEDTSSDSSSSDSSDSDTDSSSTNSSSETSRQKRRTKKIVPEVKEEPREHFEPSPRRERPDSARRPVNHDRQRSRSPPEPSRRRRGSSEASRSRSPPPRLLHRRRHSSRSQSPAPQQRHSRRREEEKGREERGGSGSRCRRRPDSIGSRGGGGRREGSSRRDESRRH